MVKKNRSLVEVIQPNGTALESTVSLRFSKHHKRRSICFAFYHFPLQRLESSHARHAMRWPSLMIGIGFVLLLAAAGEAIAQQQDRWIEDIGLQMTLQLPSPSVGHAYSLQLQSVRQALAEKNRSAIQRSMGRLITMLGTKEGDISADTARSLLSVIDSITPRQYLDQNAQSHLRLIHEFSVADQGPEALQGGGGNTFEHPGGGLYAWEFSGPTSSSEYRRLWDGRVHPVVVLGIGIVLLMVVSVAVLLYRELRQRQAQSESQKRSRHAA